jgi:hypothetical protein
MRGEQRGGERRGEEREDRRREERRGEKGEGALDQALDKVELSLAFRADNQSRVNPKQQTTAQRTLAAKAPNQRKTASARALRHTR